MERNSNKMYENKRRVTFGTAVPKSTPRFQYLERFLRLSHHNMALSTHVTCRLSISIIYHAIPNTITNCHPRPLAGETWLIFLYKLKAKIDSMLRTGSIEKLWHFLGVINLSQVGNRCVGSLL